MRKRFLKIVTRILLKSIEKKDITLEEAEILINLNQKLKIFLE